MTSIGYRRLPNADPDESLAFNFNSIHDFGKSAPGLKYKSIFTYSSLDFSGSMDAQKHEKVEISTFGKICAGIMATFSYLLFVLTFPISAWFSFKTIQAYERLVVFRIGRLLAAKGPGIVLVLPCIDKWYRVDLRMRAFSVPPQRLITSDGSAVEVGADVFYRVLNPLLSVTSVKDFDHSSRIIAQTVLQRMAGKAELNSLEIYKSGICEELRSDINTMMLHWGVEVSKVDLSPVKVLQHANTLVSQSNPLNWLGHLGPLLMPPGSATSNLSGTNGLAQPMEQMLMMGGGGISTSTEAKSKIDGMASFAGLESPKGLLSLVEPHLNAGLVKEFDCIYKFVITGPDPVELYLDLKNGEGSCGENLPVDRQADVTLTTDLISARQILSGQVTAFNAYIAGGLEVSGDLKAAMRLGELMESLKK